MVERPDVAEYKNTYEPASEVPTPTHSFAQEDISTPMLHRCSLFALLASVHSFNRDRPAREAESDDRAHAI